MDTEFCDLQIQEQQWPAPLPDIKSMYKKCVTTNHSLAHNIMCASCGCIYHDISKFETIPDSFEPLRHLLIPLLQMMLRNDVNSRKSAAFSELLVLRNDLISTILSDNEAVYLWRRTLCLINARNTSIFVIILFDMSFKPTRLQSTSFQRLQRSHKANRSTSAS